MPGAPSFALPNASRPQMLSRKGWAYASFTSNSCAPRQCRNPLRYGSDISDSHPSQNRGRVGHPHLGYSRENKSGALGSVAAHNRAEDSFMKLVPSGAMCGAPGGEGSSDEPSCL